MHLFKSFINICFLAGLLIITVLSAHSKKEERKCRGCVSILEKISKRLPTLGIHNHFSPNSVIEEEVNAACKAAELTEEHLFCYYMINALNQTFSVPVLKELASGMSSLGACKRLQKVDPKICEGKHYANTMLSTGTENHEEGYAKQSDRSQKEPKDTVTAAHPSSPIGGEWTWREHCVQIIIGLLVCAGIGKPIPKLPIPKFPIP
ncbi:uncharacterized protein LOC129592871 isoform X2 [Paramacrobiotus metropolitanus]|uniref:uncharacterized protein LOC129592871 isoform X2 n=1 Tax=Paramacrobiotus metropolitanus TaxID=2943436 RepID=UPI002445F910|nr:uncharacterized protein LOC129592871 isoform X2 [Paramacrobiotus metropolitanus]